VSSLECELEETEYPMVYNVDDSLLEEEIAAGECDDMSGWYWKPEEIGDFFGPFDTEAEAIADAQREG